MSPQEESYLCHLISQESLQPKQKLLLETAEQLYGKKLKDLPAKTCTNFEAGESILEEKTLSHFRKEMVHYHFSITQLSFNMGKLTGDQHMLLRFSPPREQLSSVEQGMSEV